MARAKRRSSPTSEAGDSAPVERGGTKRARAADAARVPSAASEAPAPSDIPRDVLGQQNLIATAFAAPPAAATITKAPVSDAPTTIAPTDRLDAILSAAAQPLTPIVTPTIAPIDAPAAPSAAPDAMPEFPRPKTSLDSLLKRNPGLLRRRMVKAVLGLLITVVVGYLPAQRFLELSSSEAVVNARLVTIRSPIDGQVDIASALPEIGSRVAANTVLLRVNNPRADRGRLDDVRRLRDTVESERAGIAARLELLRGQYAGLREQTRYFQEGRVRQLEAQVAATESEIAAARATRTEAEATLGRTTALLQSGTQTRAALDRAQRDQRVAEQGETTLRRRLTATQIELEAARKGKFVGDSYNDRPTSSAQADEVALRISELEADLRIRDERLVRLAASEREEAARYAQQASAALVAPVAGNLWEMMTTPGEDVRAGREVLRILDCSHMLVTAVVSEKTYASLRLGSPARFRPLGESSDYAGKVIQLTGLAAPSDNLAIGTSALTRDTYRVIVSVPGLKTPGCAVGHSGRVTFTPGASEISAEAADQGPSPLRLSRQ
jgi:multidrug resistance efflux pump